LNINKTFGADERIRTSLGVQNLLNDKREIVFSSFGAQDQIFTQLAPGTRVNFSVGFSF
jgi:outer membrane receptor protein involved in Fe transport